MATTERREVRVVKTQRTTSSQNVHDFDNNLDTLLEDLQSSVSRPGSNGPALGSGSGSSATSASFTRVKHLSAANPTTVLSDGYKLSSSAAPADSVRSMHTYKENYAVYSGSAAADAPPTHIHKLDTLLDDLQQVRQDTHASSYMEAGAHATNKRSVQRELVYEVEGAQQADRAVDVNAAMEDSVVRQVRHLQRTTAADAQPPGELIAGPTTDMLAELEPGLLPPPNTKVTTTIKTYTYEIPGTGYPSPVSPKLSDTVHSSNMHTPSHSFTYSSSQQQLLDESATHAYMQRAPSPRPRPPAPASGGGGGGSGSTTNLYIYNTSEQRSVPPHQVHVLNETTLNTNVRREAMGPPRIQDMSRPAPGPGPVPALAPAPGPLPPVAAVPGTYGQVGGERRPPRDTNVNITYKYTAEHTATNNYRGQAEAEPLLQPPPFPTEPATDGPPKRLDVLLAEIGSEPPNSAYNAGYNAKQAEAAAQRKEQVHVHASEMPKSKNVAGPPVYYPPGHELFAHKEEAAGGYAAQGGMMRESGKYKYEEKSSSKTKSSSGVAVVPVCLPLCCGLPCVIM